MSGRSQGNCVEIPAVTGPKLITGILIMGIAVPLLLYFLLELETLNQFLTVSAVTFFAWGVADVASEIIVRPRLHDRNPRGALQDWEKQKNESGEGEADP